MGSGFDPSTIETSTSRLTLADDLVFVPQAHGQRTYFHIEHTSSGKFYRVGYPEYVFLSLLDGRRTIAQALTITARMLGAKALSHARGIEVATWLVQHRLASFAEQVSAWSPCRAETNGRLAKVFGLVDPFWIKCPLGSPDPLLSAVLPIARWLFSAWGTLAGLMVVFVGAGCLVSRWPKFVASAATVLTPHNWLWMIVAWACLKLIHELAHGLACKYYGGEVRETGFIFILFAPMAYVDVTSCWRFPSRWQRIHVAAAGMFAELVVAGIAAIVWAHTGSSVIQHLLANMIVMASSLTLLFNANPLMRFDGYYILVDLLQIPNLADEGNRALKAAASRVFFGNKMRQLQVLGFRRWVVPAYGLSAAAWRLLMCVSLVTAASVLFQGAGLLLAFLGVISWFGRPLGKLGVDLLRRLDEHRPSFVRACTVGALMAAVFAAVLIWVPCPASIKAPVVVDYADLSVMRVGAPGFVRRVHVVDGQMVQAGQLLVELDNDDLAAEQRELELALEQELVRHRVALNDQDAVNAQIAQRNLQATKERLEEVRKQSQGLEIRAPLAGRIVARDLPQTVGTYVREGAEVLTVADEARKELVMSVAQEEIDAINPQVGSRTRFRVGDRLARMGRFDRIDPRASTALPHPAMSSAAGGPLVVRGDESEGDSSMRLVEPRFRGVVTLTPETCLDLGAGEQGHVMLGWRQESIGEFLWVRFYRWLEALLSPARN